MMRGLLLIVLSLAASLQGVAQTHYQMAGPYDVVARDDIAFLIEDLLTYKLLLPFLRVLDFGTQTGRLTLMVEVSAIDGVQIIVNSYEG